MTWTVSVRLQRAVASSYRDDERKESRGDNVKTSSRALIERIRRYCRSIGDSIVASFGFRALLSFVHATDCGSLGHNPSFDKV